MSGDRSSPRPAGESDPNAPTHPLLIAAVGSANRVKVAAVGQVLASYIPAVSVRPYAVASGISEQPMTMEETITGAKNRAEKALVAALAEPAGKEAPCLSFGIESGLFSPDGGTTYFDVCAVSLFDGVDHHIGFSSAFQIPPAVARFVLEEGKDLSQATNAAGLVDDPKLGEGQVNRAALFACSAALCRENPLFSSLALREF